MCGGAPDINPGNDYFEVDSSSSLVFAGGGNDYILLIGGGSGSPTYYCNARGTCSYDSIQHFSRIHAGAGDDIIEIQDFLGRRTIYGEDGDDVIIFHDFQTRLEAHQKWLDSGNNFPLLEFWGGGRYNNANNHEGGKDTIDLRMQIETKMLFVSIAPDEGRIQIDDSGNGRIDNEDLILVKLVEVDNVVGSLNDDHIEANSDANIISGFLGADRISGGFGNDTLHGDFQPKELSNKLREMAWPESWERLYDYAIANHDHSDTINGGFGNDKIHGDLGDDILTGGPGDNEIYGGIGDDRILGGWGNDLLYGGAGNDNMSAGPDDGYNTLVGDEGNDHITGGPGVDYIFGGEGDDFLTASYYYYGDGVYNYLGGGGGDDELIGTNADSNLFGGSGADTIWGGSGSEWIVGGSGSDELRGADGADKIEGGADTDTLWGGGGIDTFVFQEGDGADEIIDFNPDQDKLLFNGLGGTVDNLRIETSDRGATVWYGTGNNDLVLLINRAVSDLTDDLFVFS